MRGPACRARRPDVRVMARVCARAHPASPPAETSLTDLLRLQPGPPRHRRHPVAHRTHPSKRALAVARPDGAGRDQGAHPCCNQPTRLRQEPAALFRLGVVRGAPPGDRVDDRPLRSAGHPALFPKPAPAGRTGDPHHPRQLGLQVRAVQPLHHQLQRRQSEVARGRRLRVAAAVASLLRAQIPGRNSFPHPAPGAS
jgi:hypothetical protein